MAEWHQQHGGCLRGEYRPTRHEYVYIAEMGDPPPLRFGIILGDCVHNLRSSLDVLMWQLVLLRGGTPSRRTQFPIFVRRASYRTRAPAMIEGVHRRDRGALERLQPFYNSRGRLPAGAHPLAMLARLSNADKHRLVHMLKTGLGLAGDPPSSRTVEGIPNEDAGQIVKTTWRRQTELQDGDEIVRFRIAPIGPTPIVTFNCQLTIGASFESCGSFLPYIREGVEHVLDVLAPEFDPVQSSVQHPDVRGQARQEARPRTAPP